MRIATFNVNSINARLTFLLEWLAARGPDIVCLQELKLTTEAFPYEALAQAGYHTYAHGQKSWNGVAVLSRTPGELVCAGLPEAEASGARFVQVVVGELTVASVYVPNGKTVAHADYAMKLEFLAKLAAHLRETLGRKSRVVVGGDFNVAHTDADSHSPQTFEGTIFHTEQERRALDAFTQAGLVDLYRARYPEGREYSWWDYRAGGFHRNHGLRIDLLYGDRAIAETAREVFTDREFRKKREGLTPSDHAPVIADLDDAPSLAKRSAE